MRGSRALVFVVFLMLSVFSWVPLSNADTVIRSDLVDLFPAGDMEDGSEWDVSTQSGFSEGTAAEHTVAMVEDGHLSITHQRPLNIDEVTSWAGHSPSESNLSLGHPDGGYTWSTGPVIELESFDFSSLSGTTLHNVSLLVAFAVPDVLQDDELRIMVEWGANPILVRSFAHTQSAIDNMQGNPLEITLDSHNAWTWQDISALLVTIDYVSVGGIDDTEVRVDAVGVKVKHQASWSGLDSAKAVNVSTMEMAPFHQFELTTGTQTSLVTTACGLELVDGSTAGGWVTETIELPHDQSWGRLYLEGNSASTSILAKSSSDGENWQSTAIQSGDLVQAYKYLKVDIALFSGCIESLRVDFNDPTLTVIGNIAGDVGGLAGSFSYISFAIGTNLLGTIPITPGPFTLSYSVGGVLPAAGDDLSLGIGARFQWSSNGSAETVVVSVEDAVITGGFVVEWDYDPQCETPSEVFLEEDASGDVIPLRTTCTDDITPQDELQVQVSSDDEALLVASVSDGQIVLRQQEDASGISTVSIGVSDQRGNLWESEFDVIVSAVDDSPTMNLLPLEILAAVGESVKIELGVGDKDTDLANISITTDVSWAVIDSYGDLVITPIAPGTFDLTVSASDGTTTITHSMNVISTSDPDLLVESVEMGDGSIYPGDIVNVQVWVRNQGESPASLVNVRFYANEVFVASSNVSYIAAGGLESTNFDWVAPIDSGQVSLRIEVDATRTILEVSEDNNEYNSFIDVLDAEDSGDGGLGNSGISAPPSTMFWLVLAIVVIGGFLALQLGPGKVRRNL